MKPLPPVEWTDLPMDRLLELETLAPGQFRNIPNDSNRNGRSYGGHSIAIALQAASRTVPADRPASMLQFMFLKGVLPGVPVDYQVTSLQDGKRFSSRHIRALQNGQAVLDAHATFARPAPADRLAHADAPPADLPGPQASVRVTDLPPASAAALEGLGSYSFAEKSCIEFRLPRPEQLAAPGGCNRFEFWMRARSLPADDLHGQSVGLAYLSDWWINFPSLSAHIAGLQRSGDAIYVASLNHSIWFHRHHDPREWMLLACDSPRAVGGRGLALAAVYDAQGGRVATISQECLMAARLDA
ncbi:hypothetical protein ASF44_25305 [Pseudorhodoferax sp. Leaf274]|nr:hypothetical protein ASF44_25305 [Pseudorhodoferax sp. Leaf274]